MRTILYGREYMKVNDKGEITRPEIGMTEPSGQWRITGAVTLNNFGYVVAHFTLRDILDNPQDIPWKHKNGKQKTHITDSDHGTHRTWGNPEHRVF